MEGVLFENGKNVNSYNGVLWDGLFSKVLSNGKIIEYIQTILPNNVLCIIPKSDGNISKHDTIQDYRDIDWDTHIQPYIDYAEK